MRLHDAVHMSEPDSPEVALPEELLARFRAADPTRNASCLPWLLRTYAAGGYRLEDLSKAHDTLAAFARLRGQLPNTATIDGETRNPRKLGSHVTLASLWSVIAPLVEAERLAQEEEAGEQVDTDKERALSQSRVLHRSNRMVVAVPLTKEASCWWGQGTQWCTAARKNNAFENYHKNAPLIVVCLRKSGDLPARKLQLYVYAGDIQFMDENDAPVSPELILERWQDLEALIHWLIIINLRALRFLPEHLRTEAICLAAVGSNGWALQYVPEPLRTEAICLAAVASNGWALEYVPEPLCTEAICTIAVGRDGYALAYIPKPLRTEALCTAAVGKDGWVLNYVPEHLRTEAMCLDAVCRNGGALEYVPEPLRTKAMCTVAVGSSGMALRYVPENLRTEAIFTAAVGECGMVLEYVPEPLRTKAICTVAVGRYGRALEYVPERLRTETMCLAAVGKDGWALLYVPEPLRTKEMCTAAVKHNGWALRYVPLSLRTETICLAAVGSDGRALEYVPEPLRTEEICLVALEQNGEALEYVPEHLRTEAICTAAIGGSKQKPHDSILEGLEDYLKNLKPINFIPSP